MFLFAVFFNSQDVRCDGNILVVISNLPELYERLCEPAERRAVVTVHKLALEERLKAYVLSTERSRACLTLLFPPVVLSAASPWIRSPGLFMDEMRLNPKGPL